jgi:hypothetical protein
MLLMNVLLYRYGLKFFVTIAPPDSPAKLFVKFDYYMNINGKVPLYSKLF